MSSYPGPIAILPIFNSQEFNYSSSSLSICTADKRYLRLTGGILSGLLTANGNLNTPSMTLTGTGTPASFANIKLNAYDTINNYLQFNLQNLSSGSSASTDIVCTNNNGNDTAGFIDMGINSTTNTSTIDGASDSYLYSIADLSGNGGNLFVGTQSAKTLYLFANTATPTSSNSISWEGSNLNMPTGSQINAVKQKVGSTGTVLNRIEQGSFTFTNTSLGALTGASQAISFSSSFLSTPNVILTINYVSGTNQEKLTIIAGNVSTTGFTCYIWNTYSIAMTGNVNISYIALN